MRMILRALLGVAGHPLRSQCLAIPFLLALVADSTTPGRHEIIQLLLTTYEALTAYAGLGG
jgi:hypothetical protein